MHLGDSLLAPKLFVKESKETEDLLLHFQFDSVIMDRPMILQALHQLSSRLPDRRILTWEFFFNRFDALYLEAQIALEKYGDIAFPRGKIYTVR